MRSRVRFLDLCLDPAEKPALAKIPQWHLLIWLGVLVVTSSGWAGEHLSENSLLAESICRLEHVSSSQKDTLPASAHSRPRLQSSPAQYAQVGLDMKSTP